MNEFIENSAHFVHGAAFMFFLCAAILVFPKRRENNIVRMLFWCMAAMTLIEVKDMVYLAGYTSFSDYINNICVLADMFFIPLVALLSMAILSPARLSRRRIAFIFLPFVLLCVIYILSAGEVVMAVSMVFSMLYSVVFTLMVYRISSKYDNYVKNNFSNLDGISVDWLKNALTVLVIWMLSWFFLVRYNSSLLDTFYYTFTIVIWMFIYRLSLKQKVLFAEPDAVSESGGQEGEEVHEEASSARLQKLEKSMREEKLFLKADLTLAEVASHIGTNRTYLSSCLNQELNSNFYEYVNSFRVAEACRILNSDSLITMQEVAVKSGFNSLSTFNRSFSKFMRISPGRYRENRNKL